MLNRDALFAPPIAVSSVLCPRQMHTREEERDGGKGE